MNKLWCFAVGILSGVAIMGVPALIGGTVYRLYSGMWPKKEEWLLASLATLTIPLLCILFYIAGCSVMELLGGQP